MRLAKVMYGSDIGARKGTHPWTWYSRAPKTHPFLPISRTGGKEIGALISFQMTNTISLYLSTLQPKVICLYIYLKMCLFFIFVKVILYVIW
jgi:hypothetical protein